MINNPFHKPDENCDVVLYVDNVALYVHEWILCNNSPVLKEKLEQIQTKTGRRNGVELKELELKDIKVESVIKMIQFFYTDHLQDICRCKYLKEMLCLCREYQVQWLMEEIRKYLSLQFQSSGYIWRLHLAEEFKFKDLKEKLILNSHKLSFNSLLSQIEFVLLQRQTMFDIIIKQFENNLEEQTEGVVAILEFFHSMFKQTLLE